ncbi:MAG: hypothetical protein DHS20C15_19190 [Planctomycetota bacterium]|nr:MAG: hypothetical protein DHS20C15_19190 [Planctomycetota bacterium]
MSSSSRGESRRRRGGSLVTKLTGTFAALVAIFMIVFLFLLTSFVEQAVTERVLRQASVAARTASQADIAAWTKTFGTEDQGLSLAEIQERLQAMSPSERRIYTDNPRRLAQEEWNSARFERFVQPESEIVAAELLRLLPDGSLALAASSYGGDLDFRPVRGGGDEAFGTGSAVEGILVIDGSQRRVIRGSHPLTDRDGAKVGEISVYIASASIEAAAARLKLKVAYVAMAFVLIGALVAFLLGRRISGPLRRLQEDVHTVARGDLEHRTRARSSDEIGELARSVDQMTESLREARDAEREAAASRHELEVAAEVAARLTPETFFAPAGWDVAGLHHEGKGPAGEYADALQMADGRVGYLVAGASGRGVAAALVLAMARSFLRVVAASERDPGEVLRKVNGLLAGDLRQGMYVTALLVVVEPNGRSVSVANAGHPPLLHWRGASQDLDVVHSEGIALGFDSGPVFDRTLRVASVQLGDGDRVVLHAPGLMELPGADGTPLGERRFVSLVEREAPLISESFVGRVDATLKRFAGGGRLESDVTLLTLARL